jgi:hypothetical protein
MQYLPGHVWPSLKELTPELALIGAAKEFDLPDLKNASDILLESENPFNSILGHSRKKSSEIS